MKLYILWLGLASFWASAILHTIIFLFAFFNDGIIYLRVNKFNEHWLELVIVVLMFVFMCIYTYHALYQEKIFYMLEKKIESQ